MRTMLKLLLFLCVGVFCVIGGLIMIGLLLHSNDSEVGDVTTPLRAEVVQDLCEKLLLTTDDPRCQLGTTVYAPDFADAVEARFEIGTSTYTKVQMVLGEYLYSQEARVVTADGYSSFRCWYDFRGDHVFPIVFRFSGQYDVVDSIAQVQFDSP